MNTFDILKIIMDLEIYSKSENTYHPKTSNSSAVVDRYLAKVGILNE